MAKLILPRGFTVSGVHCGLKKSDKDLGLIFSDTPCATAGVFTNNNVKAAPILVTKEILGKGGKTRAIVVNSGNANCCTGKYCTSDAKEMVKSTALGLGIKYDSVLVASTGVIGKKLPIEKIKTGIPHLVKNLSSKGLMSLVQAIMTTDTKKKVRTAKFVMNGKGVIITGLCKGAGMIHPNMATMLCFIMTDAAMDGDALKAVLKESVNKSFNVITVDGDMSTNDCVLVLANGKAGGPVVKKNSKDYKIFKQHFDSICLELAKDIVRDGEGATKFIEIEVAGAKTGADAEKIARIIANSPLVKTSIHGQDPNWGRIASSVGSSMLDDITPDKMEIYLDNVGIFKKGKFADPPAEKLSRIYKKDSVYIFVNLNLGKKSAKMYTCDLSKRYVDINAHYLT